MKHLLYATVLAAAFTFGNAAAAADATVGTTPYDWSGVYVGLQAGGAWMEGDDGFDTLGMNGGTFGAYAGANWQVANVILGVEADVAYTSTDGNFLNVEYGTDWHGALRGRLGYAIDNFMIYGAAGLAVTRAYVDVSPIFVLDETFTGWTVGGGGEYAFAPNWTARLDYRYSDYGSSDFGASSLGYGTFSEVRLTEHTVRVGVGYKF